MSRYKVGQNKQQRALLSEHLDDFTAEDNPTRVIDQFVGEPHLAVLQRWSQ